MAETTEITVYALWFDGKRQGEGVNIRHVMNNARNAALSGFQVIVTKEVTQITHVQTLQPEK